MHYIGMLFYRLLVLVSKRVWLSLGGILAVGLIVEWLWTLLGNPYGFIFPLINLVIIGVILRGKLHTQN